MSRDLLRVFWREVLTILCAMLVVATLLLIAALVLAGCPARPPVTTGANECAPSASRCSPSGRPEICSPEHRWYRTAAEPCPAGSQCCLAASPDGPPIHACVPPSACLPEALGRVVEPGTATGAGVPLGRSPGASAAEAAGASPAAPSGATRDPFAAEEASP